MNLLVVALLGAAAVVLDNTVVAVQAGSETGAATLLESLPEAYLQELWKVRRGRSITLFT